MSKKGSDKGYSQAAHECEDCDHKFTDVRKLELHRKMIHLVCVNFAST